MFGMMSCLLTTAVFSLISLPALAQNILYGEQIYECPQHWMQFQESCYRFIKSPLRPREDARKNCQAFHMRTGELMTDVDSEEQSADGTQE